MPIPSSPNALLAHPFRPFFLLVGVYGVLIVLAWMAFLFGGLPLPLGWSPLHWHSHEMIYGLRSEEHTSELQSRGHLVCRLLLEKKKIDRQGFRDDVLN